MYRQYLYRKHIRKVDILFLMFICMVYADLRRSTRGVKGEKMAKALFFSAGARDTSVVDSVK